MGIAHHAVYALVMVALACSYHLPPFCAPSASSLAVVSSNVENPARGCFSTQYKGRSQANFFDVVNFFANCEKTLQMRKNRV